MQDYKVGPADSMDFLMENTPEVEKFILDIGSTVEFNSSDTIFPNLLKNLGRFDVNDLADPEEEQTDSTPFGRGEENGTLIEHVPTGFIYAVMPEHYVLPVYDYDKTTDWPTNIVLRVDEPWVSVAVDAPGTRVGGTTDFSLQAWPHHKGCPLNFAAQYELPNGKYVHIFVTDDEDESWAPENGANCAIVDGGPVPSWIELKAVEYADEGVEVLLRTPNQAFTPPVMNADIPVAPSWIQGDETPEDTGYKFILQFGYGITTSNTYEGNDVLHDFFFGDCGDMYVFYKEETNEARALWQCG